ncbi:MAG: Oligopeptide/dipeptide ABC transporter, ATPase subunit [Caldanaerobacter subterraneus]|jgi:peptide/nickel transport system ATP-binding protein|uniref:Oligopeptide/dipeptide ABC transporter, ATPase subunit n=2 Tax=Thermoanaerobacter TaxID=1754 RepID=B0K7Y5_THEP3|nr:MULTISPECIES: ABC transporter ATP-binding protein [Thermoanaerobacter]KUJ89728.1 MAG: oligopeptide/dipeptide ABC transporter ATPase [Thermoanaerobacter thermocopriae]KUK35459.1 MAG: Oligopeptide/dipeptide ABC transporter, ATPase subunit [Caldanaerobacter subterraneus]ABY93077.1 oligopeptide/dipeptide ABC transporter, ATPase subunit [Thermoanaerobacter sp. X514]ABY95805.1 oligopeptide/dipeptide ABC transporter, ATPase subunit [Thermoanaerobacter pseudethanolicus ATCC 33223]ADV80735.1 oligope
MKQVIKIDHISKIFSRGFFKKQHKLVLSDINLEISQGDRLVIVGESGMGKTTLARIMANLELPSEGEVLWFEKNIQKLREKEKKLLRGKVQYIHQDPYASLHPAKTIYKIIADPLRNAQKINRKEVYEKTKQLLEKVGLTPAEYFFNKYPHHLSGGGRQRLAIARALTTEPQVIIADEPISMIDMSLRAAIIKLFKDLNDLYGIAVILVLHDIGAAKYFTYEKGEIAVLYGGKIVEKGKGREVLTNPVHPYTKVLINSSPIADPEIARNRVVEQLRSYEVPVRTPESKGCPFAHACNYYTEKCLEEDPQLIVIDSSHEVACHVFSK